MYGTAWYTTRGPLCYQDLFFEISENNHFRMFYQNLNFDFDITSEQTTSIDHPVGDLDSKTGLLAGLEMPGIPVQTGYGWKSLKVCLIDSNFRNLPPLSHLVKVSGISPSSNRIFLIPKICFLESQLAGQHRSGREGEGRKEYRRCGTRRN